MEDLVKVCFCSQSPSVGLATEVLVQAYVALVYMVNRPNCTAWMPQTRLYLKEGAVAQRRPAWRRRLRRQGSSPSSGQGRRPEAAGPGAKVRQIVCEAAQQRRSHGAHVRGDRQLRPHALGLLGHASIQQRYEHIDNPHVLSYQVPDSMSLSILVQHVLHAAENLCGTRRSC